MSFHKSNFGRFGESLPCDMRGFVPELGDNMEDFEFDSAGDEMSADEWEEFIAKAVEETEEARAAVGQWRNA